MINSRLAKRVFSLTFLLVLSLPAAAFAADPGGEVEAHIAKAIGACVAMSVSAVAAGYAQSKIGVAGAGTLAERPEAAVWVVVLQALPEIIVLLGFVASIMIVNMPVPPPAQ